jgi:hypothetical protein
LLVLVASDLLVQRRAQAHDLRFRRRPRFGHSPFGEQAVARIAVQRSPCTCLRSTWDRIDAGGRYVSDDTAPHHVVHCAGGWARAIGLLSLRRW